MSRLDPKSKWWAYENAIAYLRQEELADMTQDDYEAFRWLANKLEKEMKVYFNKHHDRICVDEE